MCTFNRLLAVASTILLLWSTDSSAISLGGFVSASSGSGAAEWENDFSSWDINSNTADFGLVIDTAPTTEKNFNYRLNIGFTRQEFKNDDEFRYTNQPTDKIKGNGFYVENIVTIQHNLFSVL